MKKNMATMVSLLAVCLLLGDGPAWAATDIEYVGRLIKEPPCTINNDQSVDVDFGEVLTSRVYAPGEYQKNYKIIPMRLNCKENSHEIISWTIMASPTSFDASSVQTNIADLGVLIEILSGTTGQRPVDLNKPMTVKSSDGTQAAFLAYPVKRAGSTLPDGNFTATATFRIDFP